MTTIPRNKLNNFIRIGYYIILGDKEFINPCFLVRFVVRKMTPGRRTVLKTIASSAAVLGTAGSSGASDGSQGNSSTSDTATADTSRVSESRTIELTEQNALSKSEFQSYAQQMEKRYGATAAAQITPKSATSDSESDDVSTMGGSRPSDTPHLDFIKAWNDEYKVKGGSPTWTVAHTDHALALYRANSTDSSGNHVYFFWHWSQAESNNDYWHPEGKIKLIESGLNSEDQNQEITKISPSNSKSVNGAYVRAGATVGVADVEVGINGEVWVEDGTLGPKTGGIDLGEAGEHYTELDLNNLTGKHTLNATTVLRSPFSHKEDFPPNLTWETRVVGDP
ncbi:hypothetical protein [Halorussus pelagicus]|uniref:hypothetical protein n=1 Tax=Halorussus pelagicus TaxID=2505977 RepID=UPI000FFC659C|nr:hypothetical protein [Halorussus pelagicus]